MNPMLLLCGWAGVFFGVSHQLADSLELWNEFGREGEEGKDDDVQDTSS